MAERCKTPDLVIDKETFALKIQHLMLSVKAKVRPPDRLLLITS